MLRRLAVLMAASMPVLAGCSDHSTPETPCAPTPPPDVTSVDGWLGQIHRFPDDVALAVDDGRGHTAERRADDAQPLASAEKVVPLAAYARAVAARELDPRERITVAEWERWYLPGTDGGAHEQARTRLTGDTVTLDELVSAMIRESDNGVADYLRDRLGDRALIDAAEAGGWRDYRPSSKIGDAIRLLDPTVTDSWAAAQRYVADPAYRATMESTPAPPFDIQARWVETTPTASARQLTAMHRAIAGGGFGPGSDIARAHLEWQIPADAPEAVGFKGGSYPGVLTDAIFVRRGDGTVATAVLLNRRMPQSTWQTALSGLNEQGLLLRAMSEPDMMRRLSCAV